MSNETALWTFEGFETNAGGHPVQDWYWDDISLEHRDLIRTRISHLETLGKHLWKGAGFKLVGKVGEIKKDSSLGALRIYGVFAEGRPAFVFLNGVIKKSTKDRVGMRTAEERLKRFRSAGRTHGFSFQERSAEEHAAQ